VVFNFSAVGGPRRGAGAGRGGDAGLATARDVGDGDEPPPGRSSSGSRRRRSATSASRRSSSNYKVLFLQAAQLALPAVPMNLLGEKKARRRISTRASGRSWRSRRRTASADVNIAAARRTKNFTYAPEQSRWQLDPTRRTSRTSRTRPSGGVESTGRTPEVLVAGTHSSHFLSRPLDVSKFGT